MLRKLMWTLSFIGILGLVSCGGGSSKEAKELLKKMLTIIGIPQEVVMNICQDSNNNDFCESTELQAKVTFNKGDSMKTIWEKITQTAEGQYLLETATPCTPILLELKDNDVEYDDGQFTLKYSGVEFGQTSKELSILEAMVDAKYISSSSVNSIKKLNSTEAQNSFYAMLYKDLKTNLNTLRTTGLTKIQAMRGTLNEMADELLGFGVETTLANRINNCDSNNTCINAIIEELSSKLIIDDNETDTIFNIEKDNNDTLNVRNVSCVESDRKLLTKLIIKSDLGYGTNTEELTFFYDDNNKLIKMGYNGLNDKIIEYSTNKIILKYTGANFWQESLYKDNNIYTGTNYYRNDVIYNTIRVLKYDSKNRPIEIEDKSDESSDIYKYTYDGEYITHIDIDSRTTDDEEPSESIDYKYNRKYKCIFMSDLLGMPLYWDISYDAEYGSCINWTDEIPADATQEIRTQEITYNNQGLPIRIDYDKQSYIRYMIFEYAN